MKRLIAVLALLILLAGGLGGFGWSYSNAYLDEPMGKGDQHKQVEIPKGATFDSVVRRLAQAGVVHNPRVFRWYGRYKKVGKRIRAGHYSVNMAWTPRQLLDKLEKGVLPPQVKLTIPEGWNRWQIADRLAALGLAKRAAFLKKVEREDLEGRLFPDTYWIRKDATLDEVIRVLTDRSDAIMREILEGRSEYRSPAARRRLLVLASLVEKEARTERDRGLVSRVFHNRLAKGMKLQTDPTCVYGAALYKETPHPRYCKDPESRYSTYVIDGLPPTPIANPGAAAIRATVRPSTGPKLLYFVARRDGSGEHHFSETHDEHRAAVQRYLK